MAGNQAVSTNSVVGQQANLAITRRGSDWYFTVCAIMGVTTIAIMAWALKKPQTHRLFHYITALITAVACIAYWSMACNLGQTPIQVEFIRGGIVHAAGTREIFYVRYIDWFVTTPLLLLDLLLTAGVPWPTILVTLVADEIMIVTGLVGALTQTRYKWGYWTFGMAAFFFVVYELLIDARRHANALGGPIQSTFVRCGVLTIFLWFLYPIAWGVSEGGNVIHPDSEAIFYGILDVLAKPGFSLLLLLGHRNIDPVSLGLRIREPAGYREKGSAVDGPAYGPGTSNGAFNNGGAAANNGVQNGTHTGPAVTNGTHTA